MIVGLSIVAALLTFGFVAWNAKLTLKKGKFAEFLTLCTFLALFSAMYIFVPNLMVRNQRARFLIDGQCTAVDEHSPFALEYSGHIFVSFDEAGEIGGESYRHVQIGYLPYDKSKPTTWFGFRSDGLDTLDYPGPGSEVYVMAISDRETAINIEKIIHSLTKTDWQYAESGGNGVSSGNGYEFARMVLLKLCPWMYVVPDQRGQELQQVKSPFQLKAWLFRYEFSEIATTIRMEVDAVYHQADSRTRLGELSKRLNRFGSSQAYWSCMKKRKR